MDIRDIKGLQERIETLQERIQRLRSAMEMGSRQLRLTPGGGACEDKLANDMAKLDELERMLVGRVAELEEVIQGAEQAIDALPSQQQVILRLRSIQGLSWRQVARESSYDERHCRRIYTKAVEKMSGNVRF